jgi:mycothiol synthase
MSDAMSNAPSHIRSATRGDLPEVVDLLVASDIAEIGEPDTTTEDVEGDWQQDGFDLATDAWVAEDAGGRIVGYAYAGDQLRNGEIEADLWVHPADADDELRGRLLGLVERRARELAAAAAYGDAAALEIYTLAANRVKRDLLVRHGFAPRRSVYRLRVDLDAAAPAAPPPGIAIRGFRRGGDDKAMRDAMSEAFKDHYRQSNESFEAWRTRLIGRPDFDADLWLLAWDGDQPVGGVIAYDFHDLGWVQGLGVRRAWRRRGVGNALLTAAFAACLAKGQPRVELSVDAEGETRPLSLYERAGMRLVHSYELLEKRLGG